MVEKLIDILTDSLAKVNWNLINSNRDLKALVKRSLEGSGVELVGIGSTSPKAGNGYLIAGGIYYEFKFRFRLIDISIDVWEL